jgi:N-carbamoylputrescine amidase
MGISVATVQMESRNGDFEGNCKRAEEYVIEAIKQGAKLISLPEFALAGYIYSDSWWNEAEPLKGRTYQWLNSLCEKHKVYIATCILEKDKEDFFCTFILCGPDHRLWSHRKVEPFSYEAFYFKGAGLNPDVFDTPIGRIGIVICLDSSRTYSMESLLKNRPDLLLMQFSCPGFPSSFPLRDRNNFVDTYKIAPVLFAKHLRVPVVSSNKTGICSSPIPLGFGTKYNADFIDQSAITDKNGNVVSVISNKSGVICCEVETATKDDLTDHNIKNGRWFLPFNSVIRFVTEYAQKTGMIRYKFSGKRKKAATGHHV